MSIIYTGAILHIILRGALSWVLARTSSVKVVFVFRAFDCQRSVALCLGMLVLNQTAAFAEDLYSVATREGFAARRTGDSKRSVQMFAIAVKESDRVGSVRNKIVALNNLAESYLSEKDSKRAQESCADALALCASSMKTDDSLFVRTQFNYDRMVPSGSANREAAVAANATDNGRVLVQKVTITSEHRSNSDDASIVDSAISETKAQTSQDTFAWSESEHNCEKDVADGVCFETISARDLRVSASLVDTGSKLRVSVRVINEGDKPVEVLPEHISLGVIGKEFYSLKRHDPEKLAASVVRRARVEAAFSNMGSALGEMGAAMQTTTTYANTRVNGSYSTFNDYGTFSGSAVSTVTSPDYAARARAARQADITRFNSMSAVRQAEALGDQIACMALKANTLRRGDSTSGSVFFERPRHGNVAVLNVPVGQSNYSFSFGVRPTNSAKKVAHFVIFGPDCLRAAKAKELLGGKSAAAIENGVDAKPDVAARSDTLNQ